MEDLGKKIKFLRMQKNLTQKQLAERAAMSANNLSLIETAKRDYLSLNVNNLIHIAEGLDMDLEIKFVDKDTTNNTKMDFHETLKQKDEEIKLLKALVQSLQTQQECAQHYFNLGIHRALMFIAPQTSDFEKEKAYDDAIRFLLKAIEIQEDFYQAWCFLGHIHLRKARKLLLNHHNHQAFLAEFKLGEHCYLKAAMIEPKHHRTFNNHINLLLVEYQLLKINQRQAAIAKLHEAKKYIDEHICLFPEYEHNFIYNLACVCANLGETMRAVHLLSYAYDEKLLVYRPREKEYILGDEDLFVLHDKPEFQKWLSDIKSVNN